MDLRDFFRKYEDLQQVVDRAFDRVKQIYPENVTCAVKCSECCHALFDIGILEAIYISDRFHGRLDPEKKTKIIARAVQADRKIYRLKRKAFQNCRSAKDARKVLAETARQRVRCPLLNEQEQCDLYDFRPVTCRAYGLPVAIQGLAHTCGKSGFVRGESYPTLNLDKMNRQLNQLAQELVRTMNTRYSGLAEMLVPVSRALLTEYDDKFLGVRKEPGCPGKERPGP
ncbi:MAG: YkgJ family cysteine cluster protein [Desulfobacterales bacterium]|nr:YkgJ family cysteine cluster protein [Desulfobacterales bacterium]